MGNEKKIEIPFGAFDSELIHQEINIPNGFNAVIEGNKIILTRAESEDEKIRESLLEYLHTLPNHYSHDGVCAPEWIAWLEKQGEQRPIWHNEDEEPKRGSLILLIMQSGTPIVAKIIEPNHTFNHGERWAYIDDLLEKQAEVESDNDDIEAEEKGIRKAFDKIRDKKQGEQKPAEKIEPFDKYEGLTDFERTLADICIGWIGEEFGWKQYIKDNADVLLKIAVEKFNSVQDVPFEQNPATSYCQEHCKGYQETGKCFADGDCKDKRKAEQKSAWSEVDEKMCQETIDWFEKKCFPYALESENPARESIKWLKSLKQRIGG